MMPLIHKEVFEALIRTSRLVSTEYQSTSLCILLLCRVSLVPWPLKDLFHEQTSAVLYPESISFNESSQLSLNGKLQD